MKTEKIWKINEDGVAEVLTTSFEGKRLNAVLMIYGWMNPNEFIFTDPLYVRDYWKILNKKFLKKICITEI